MRKDAFLFNIFFIAETLSKSMSEIKDMTLAEYNHWINYFDLKKKLQG